MNNKLKLILATGLFISLGGANDFSATFYPAHARAKYKHEKRVFHNVTKKKLCNILYKNKKGDLGLSTANKNISVHFSVKSLKAILSFDKNIDYSNCPQVVTNIRKVLSNLHTSESTNEFDKDVKK